MFAHKEISPKVCGPVRSESAPHLSFSVGLPRTLCEYLVSVLNVLYTVFVLIFHHINFSSSAITPCHALIRVKSSRMRITCKLANCGWTKKKTKPKCQLERFLWKTRVKTCYLIGKSGLLRLAKQLIFVTITIFICVGKLVKATEERTQFPLRILCWSYLIHCKP